MKGMCCGSTRATRNTSTGFADIDTPRSFASWRPTADVAALIARGQLLADIREFFRRLDVLEVQTPVLMPDTVSEPMIDSIAVLGGGWLQTSPEYAMKRLLAAGAPAIYQLGPVFRAGERGRWHNPEFTLLEWYRPGFDDQQLMQELASLVDSLFGAAPYRQAGMAIWLLRTCQVMLQILLMHKPVPRFLVAASSPTFRAVRLRLPVCIPMARRQRVSS